MVIITRCSPSGVVGGVFAREAREVLNFWTDGNLLCEKFVGIMQGLHKDERTIVGAPSQQFFFTINMKDTHRIVEAAAEVVVR